MPSRDNYFIGAEVTPDNRGYYPLQKDLINMVRELEGRADSSKLDQAYLQELLEELKDEGHHVHYQSYQTPKVIV